MNKIKMVEFLEKNGVFISKDEKHIILVNLALPENQFPLKARIIEWDMDTGKVAARVFGGKKSNYADNYPLEEDFLKAYISENFAAKKIGLWQRLIAALRVLRSG